MDDSVCFISPIGAILLQTGGTEIQIQNWRAAAPTAEGANSFKTDQLDENIKRPDSFFHSPVNFSFYLLRVLCKCLRPSTSELMRRFRVFSDTNSAHTTFDVGPDRPSSQ